MRLPVFLRPDQYSLFSVYVCFYNSHPNGSEVVSHCGFSFHLPSD